MSLTHTYIANHITIRSADWMDYYPDPAANPGLNVVKKQASALKARVAVTGTYPILNPQQSYIDTVVELLDEIRVSALGANLISSIVAEAHQIFITIPSKHVDEGMRAMRCSPSATEHGADTGIFLKLIGDVIQNNQVAARTELTGALQTAQMLGINTAAIVATAIQLAQSTANVQSCGGPVGPPVAIPARALNLTVPMVTNWSNGTTPIADNAFDLRYLALSLERWLTRGPGAPCTIKFDPWIKCDGLIRRPPIVSLFHELVHAYYNVKGMTIFTPGGQEEIEMMYIPCGAFRTIANGGPARSLTENAYRQVLHVAGRVFV
ncbi:MAG: hypothetical protein L0312_24945 [Acidobacteria bacterium]|nr:hypothetical protein [Acidobacteriota bacterium]